MRLLLSAAESSHIDALLELADRLQRAPLCLHVSTRGCRSGLRLSVLFSVRRRLCRRRHLLRRVIRADGTACVGASAAWCARSRGKAPAVALAAAHCRPSVHKGAAWRRCHPRRPSSSRCALSRSARTRTDVCVRVRAHIHARARTCNETRCARVSSRMRAHTRVTTRMRALAGECRGDARASRDACG